jgi:hypothetical protein
MEKAIKLPVQAGGTIGAVAEAAVVHATQTKRVIQFDFNGVVCRVSANTNPQLVVRDYLNASYLNWKTIGPAYDEVYSPDVEAKLAEAKQAAAEKAEARIAQMEQEDAVKRQQVEQAIAGITLLITDQAKYDEWKATNSDSEYGKGIFEFADVWGRLMQKDVASGKSVADAAQTTQFEPSYLGISGFMFGAAVSILSQCWQYGEELRQWHNGKYDHKGAGVVNPAGFTIN